MRNAAGGTQERRHLRERTSGILGHECETVWALRRLMAATPVMRLSSRDRNGGVWSAASSDTTPELGVSEWASLFARARCSNENGGRCPHSRAGDHGPGHPHTQEDLDTATDLLGSLQHLGIAPSIPNMIEVMEVLRSFAG